MAAMGNSFSFAPYFRLCCFTCHNPKYDAKSNRITTLPCSRISCEWCSLDYSKCASRTLSGPEANFIVKSINTYVV